MIGGGWKWLFITITIIGELEQSERGVWRDENSPFLAKHVSFIYIYLCGK